METGDILFVCREQDTVNISWGLIWTLLKSLGNIYFLDKSQLGVAYKVF